MPPPYFLGGPSCTTSPRPGLEAPASVDAAGGVAAMAENFQGSGAGTDDQV
jgi:hypothetical protein